MFDEILVPTDGSDCAQAAVGYAVDLARRYDARVHALCVADSRILENASHYERHKKERAAIAEETCADLSAQGIEVERAVRTDVPHEAILRYARAHDVDLVVMGTHGRTGVERFLLGSVTEKVLRLSDVPVLTVKGGAEDGTDPFTDILVPTDGSEGALAAVDPALSLAGAYDATLHALSVADVKSLGPAVRTEPILDELLEAAEAAVEAVETRAREANVASAVTAVEVGYPYSEIRSYVEDHDVDLVVMGTRGRSGISRYLLGSVTEKLVRTSPVPVMTVRRPHSE